MNKRYGRKSGYVCCECCKVIDGEEPGFERLCEVCKGKRVERRGSQGMLFDDTAEPGKIQ